MTSAIRTSTIFASLMFHGLLCGIAVYFTFVTPAVHQVRAYKVSLGSSPVASPTAPPTASEAAPQLPESAKETSPAPTIAEVPAIIPEKTIAAKTTAKKAQPKAAQRQSTVAQKSSENTQQNTSQTGSQQGTGIFPSTIQGFLAYDAKHVDEPPRIARKVDPVYPERAQKKHTEGLVVVEIVVDEQGLPCACKVVTAKPQGYFESATLKATEKTRFIPGRLQGKPVKTVVHLSYAFKLT